MISWKIIRISFRIHQHLIKTAMFSHMWIYSTLRIGGLHVIPEGKAELIQGEIYQVDGIQYYYGIDRLWHDYMHDYHDIAILST